MIFPNVLITDDDRALRAALGEALERRGFRVTLAADGGEALKIVQDEDIHLALVDVHMPRVTGLDVLRRLHDDAMKIPLILMSAAMDDEIAQEARRMDVYHLLTKPIRLTQICGLVRQGLRDVHGWTDQDS
ncbi:MAG: response regulator [Planctomycetota bacterium]